MDIGTQDAIQRLMRNENDAAYLFAYINGRRLEYLESLANYDPSDVTSMARTQGMVMALSEVLRIPEDAQTEKDTRTQ